MNRRNFIGSMMSGIATAAAVRTWPFRVYSFPKRVYSNQDFLVGSAHEFLLDDIVEQYSCNGRSRGKFRITGIDPQQRMIMLEAL